MTRQRASENPRTFRIMFSMYSGLRPSDTRSAFHPAHRHPLDEIPLEQEEDDHHRQGHEHVAGHDQGPVDAALGCVEAKGVEAQAQRELGLVAEVDEWGHELIPARYEDYDG